MLRQLVPQLVTSVKWGCSLQIKAAHNVCLVVQETSWLHQEAKVVTVVFLVPSPTRLVLLGVCIASLVSMHPAWAGPSVNFVRPASLQVNRR